MSADNPVRQRLAAIANLQPTGLRVINRGVLPGLSPSGIGRPLDPDPVEVAKKAKRAYAREYYHANKRKPKRGGR